MCDYDCEGCICHRAEPLRPWERWLNDRQYVVWPVIGGVALLVMFWMASYV